MVVVFFPLVSVGHEYVVECQACQGRHTFFTGLEATCWCWLEPQQQVPDGRTPPSVLMTRACLLIRAASSLGSGARQRRFESRLFACNAGAAPHHYP